MSARECNKCGEWLIPEHKRKEPHVCKPEILGNFRPQTTQAEELSLGEWISVEDRLPEEAELMEKPEELEWLVFDGVKVSTTATHPANWNYDFELGIDINKKVTHWMPLPNPPSPANNKE